MASPVTRANIDPLLGVGGPHNDISIAASTTEVESRATATHLRLNFIELLLGHEGTLVLRRKELDGSSLFLDAKNLTDRVCSWRPMGGELDFRRSTASEASVRSLYEES